MNLEVKLPEGFDGTFRFTNWTDEDFSAKWNNILYTFPKGKMTPMVISTATPLEIQNIRKKFAKELAEREFFKSQKYEALDKKNVGVSFHGAVTYTENDLTTYLQRCLEPLPVGEAKAEVQPTESEKRPKPGATRIVKSKLSGDDKDESLVEAAKRNED